MKRGFTFVELIIYVSVLAVILLVFSNSVLSISRSYGQLKIIRDLDSAAIDSMERVTREIRAAASVDTIQSVLGTNPGVLFLNQVDSNGNNASLKFSVTNSVLHIWQNGADLGSLLPAGVTVRSLVFYLIDTGGSKAVKVEMQLGETKGKVLRYSNYYSTVILRGSYK
ncbi:MAG: prepilin-type N-terminal cleavage/methylation domain-containing protein [Candidatus Vogelbacteria bacterium]|nr:prepilin-type N-terminal cleavage/methylation domain-containing protein [Candidatus Vogelbacteria bacterium]